MILFNDTARNDVLLNAEDVGTSCRDAVVMDVCYSCDRGQQGSAVGSSRAGQRRKRNSRNRTAEFVRHFPPQQMRGSDIFSADLVDDVGYGIRVKSIVLQ